MCEVTVSPTFDALIQFANMTVVGEYFSIKVKTLFKKPETQKEIKISSNIVY